MKNKMKWSRSHLLLTLGCVNQSLENFKTIRQNMNNGIPISSTEFENLLRTMIMVRSLSQGFKLQKSLLLAEKAEEILFDLLKKEILLEGEIFDALFWTFLKVRVLLKQVLHEGREHDEVLSELRFIHGALAFRKFNKHVKVFELKKDSQIETTLNDFHKEVMKVLEDFDS